MSPFALIVAAALAPATAPTAASAVTTVPAAATTAATAATAAAATTAPVDPVAAIPAPSEASAQDKEICVAMAHQNGHDERTAIAAYARDCMGRRAVVREVAAASTRCQDQGAELFNLQERVKFLSGCYTRAQARLECAARGEDETCVTQTMRRVQQALSGAMADERIGEDAATP